MGFQEQELKKEMKEKSWKKTKTETQVFRPPGLGMRFLLTPHTTDVHYHLANLSTTPTPTQTCPNDIPDATGDFLFLDTSLPQQKEAGWGRGAKQQQQKPAAATAAAARARGNEINTARRSNALLTCRLVVF